jgi:hypothetical protein
VTLVRRDHKDRKATLVLLGLRVRKVQLVHRACLDRQATQDRRVRLVQLDRRVLTQLFLGHKVR